NALTGAPPKLVAAVPVLVYCPTAAMPLAEQVVEAFGARLAITLLPLPQLIAVASSLLSVTAILLNVTFPLLVTWYVHVTVEPTITAGPGALLLSVPLVFFTIESFGAVTAGTSLAPHCCVAVAALTHAVLA